LNWAAAGLKVERFGSKVLSATAMGVLLIA
jgi:hypothetical protein